MSAPPTPQASLLSVSDLHVEFRTDGGAVKALHGISYAVNAGEFVGLIGETGSGKSVSLRAALGMLPRNGRITAGQSFFQGKDLQKLRGKALRRVKGEDIGFVPQQPWSALNPVMTLEKQFLAVGLSHGRSADWIRHAAREMLRKVEIIDTERVLRGYVGELSGGMAQRVLIAISLLLSPALLVADEPTTALDLTVQRDILDLLAGICGETGTGVLLVTHDLGVVSNYCDRLYVMQSGRVVEDGHVRHVFSDPSHAYTRQLIDASARHTDPNDYAVRIARASSPALSSAPERAHA